MKLKCLLLLLTGMLLLTGCKRQSSDARPRITVSIEPLRYVVEAIASHRYSVTTLMPQGASPETYEPSPRNMVALGESQLVFRCGTLGFEQTKLPQMLKSVPKVRFVDLSHGIALLQSNHHHHGHEASESADPHLWLSPENLKSMAGIVASELCHADAPHAAYYKQRLAAFEKKMNQLNAQLQQMLRQKQGTAFLIYHPALGYFARQYGLTQLAVENDGKEPSAAYLQQLIGTSQSHNVKVVFISEEHNGRAAQRIATHINARVVRINPLSYDVPQQLLLIAQSL